jgi:hypothetical protein
MPGAPDRGSGASDGPSTPATSDAIGGWRSPDVEVDVDGAATYVRLMGADDADAIWPPASEGRIVRGEPEGITPGHFVGRDIGRHDGRS